MDYWKVIADEMKAEGWSVGWNTVATANVVLWSAEANRGDGNRYIARAEELSVAMLELQKMTRAAE